MSDRTTPEYPCTCFTCKGVYTDREYPPDWAKGLCPACNAPETFARILESSARLVSFYLDEDAR